VKGSIRSGSIVSAWAGSLVSRFLPVLFFILAGRTGSRPAACTLRVPRARTTPAGRRGVNRELDPAAEDRHGTMSSLQPGGCVADKLHLDQQDDGGKDRQQEFHQDPIVPEQAPRGVQ